MARDRTARTRIRQQLATSGPVVDPSGYATGVLKDAIGYTGSSVAFIQLIAAMDRDGEIEREIRGKRTYRITGVGVPASASSAAVAPTAPSQTAVATVSTPGQPVIELDYTKLARALVQELLSATLEARSTVAAAATSDGSDADGQAAERDEYARRLEVARQKIDELLGEPMREASTADRAKG